MSRGRETSFFDIVITPEGVVDNVKVQKGHKLSYYNDPGRINMSYSRRGTLHNCPRKFQLLEKKQRLARVPTIHTAYGHAFGAGVASYWKYQDKRRAFLDAFLAWDYESVTEHDEKSNKSLRSALACLNKYIEQIYPVDSQEYRLAQIGEKNALELFFVVRIGGRYTYQGHIDVMLEHIETGAYCPLEVKTSTREFTASMWANSAQTIGYNVIVDHVAKREDTTSEYHALYLCLNTKSEEFTPFKFTRSKATRADFLTTILLDCRIIELYEEYNFYPKNGNACKSNFGECEFFGMCDDETLLNSPDGQDAYASAKPEDVDYMIEFDDLLATQSALLDEAADLTFDFDKMPQGDENA